MGRAHCRRPREASEEDNGDRSLKAATLFLFLGTASPIPCDVFYLACGAKEYPAGHFWVTAALARLVRYVYLGYGYSIVLR